MFGGFGITLDGVMFALIADDRLYLKVDYRTRPDYETAGAAEPAAYFGTSPFPCDWIRIESAPAPARRDHEASTIRAHAHPDSAPLEAPFDGCASAVRKPVAPFSGKDTGRKTAPGNHTRLDRDRYPASPKFGPENSPASSPRIEYINSV